MRWKHVSNPSQGDVKIKSWFAFLPVKIGDDYRWLERVTVEYHFRPPHFSFDRIPDNNCYWFKDRFVDD